MEASIDRLPDCIYSAPYLVKPPSAGKPGMIMRACCNHWDCPRCGQYRAKHEYGRIVEGCRTLRARGHRLYFATITMRGDADSETYQSQYLEATNRLLTNWRKRAKAEGETFEYAHVTEFQRRGVPHSHLIVTTKPHDAFFVEEDYEAYVMAVAEVNAAVEEGMRYAPDPKGSSADTEMFSAWLQIASAKAGLGVQARISLIDTVEGASRYVAKYLFKSLTEAKFPKKWRRVRYSRGFPALPEIENKDMYAVVKRQDWQRVRSEEGEICATSVQAYEAARRAICVNVTIDKKLEELVLPMLR